MNSIITPSFLDRLRELPDPVRQQASRAYALWRVDPHHPGLQFKRVNVRLPIYSARVGLGHRALERLTFESDASRGGRGSRRAGHPGSAGASPSRPCATQPFGALEKGNLPETA